MLSIVIPDISEHIFGQVLSVVCHQLVLWSKKTITALQMLPFPATLIVVVCLHTKFAAIYIYMYLYSVRMNTNWSRHIFACFPLWQNLITERGVDTNIACRRPQSEWERERLSEGVKQQEHSLWLIRIQLSIMFLWLFNVVFEILHKFCHINFGSEIATKLKWES